MNSISSFLAVGVPSSRGWALWRRRACQGGVLLAAVLLTACSSGPVRQAGTGAAEPAVGAPTAPSARRGGGYYKDDGPDDTPPANLDAVPDAVPRVEPLHRFANRPYTALGHSFVPATTLAPYRERGLASWYGRRFHGKPTSSGEPYDMYAMTAAHPTLPIPSYARVTHVPSGRSVVVRVNDRGPFHKGRLIDLSYTAAHRLGYINAGSAEVEVEQILPDEIPMVASANPVPPLPGRRGPEAAPVAPGAPLATTVSEPGLKVQGSGVFLQLGVFASRDNAEGFRATVEREVAAYAERLELFADDGRFRLHAGPYASVEAAREAALRIADALKLNPFVVVR